MECAANYEIKTDCSVVADDLVLRIEHPRGHYRARIQNIPRSDYTTPFLLSVHLYFGAPTLNETPDIADGILADCLNILAFTTGASFRRHRLWQIVDAALPKTTGMRSILMWTDSIEHNDPQPFLSEETAVTAERLLEFDIPPAIRRALRWYRLGVNSTVPDDQFMYFWFALEIVAEFQKSKEKVPDRCPHCQSPLYCETCKKYPTHRPYAKQAIRDLLKAVDKECDDDTVKLLDKTRNSLMHGSTLKEIEDSLPQPHEQIVDTLGRLLWRTLIHQFPQEMFDGKLPLGLPSTYLHYTAHGVAHVKTVVPVGADGDFDLSFEGMSVKMEPLGPPQSAHPSVISMTPEQHERLGRLMLQEGNHKEMCQRVRRHII